MTGLEQLAAEAGISPESLRRHLREEVSREQARLFRQSLAKQSRERRKREKAETK